MNLWNSIILGLAGLYGAAGVALAAWASHRAGGEILMTAALFLLLHAAAMLAIALAPARRALLWGASILATGVGLFSGDLALRLIANVKPLALAAPFGGMLMILGWLWLAGAAFTIRAKNNPPRGLNTR